MGLYTIHADGDMYWKCANPKCGKQNGTHISDTQVQYVDSTSVSLPPCAGCGTSCTVKVAFSEEELRTDNMVQYGMVPEQHTLPHAITGEPIPVLIPALKPVGRNPYIDKHIELAKQLEKYGKFPKEQL